MTLYAVVPAPADFVPPRRDRYTRIALDELPDENRAIAGKLLDEL